MEDIYQDWTARAHFGRERAHMTSEAKRTRLTSISWKMSAFNDDKILRKESTDLII